MRWKWAALGVLSLSVLAAGAGVSFYGGYIVSGNSVSPLVFIQKVETKLFRTSLSETLSDGVQYSSIFLNLDAEQFDIPGDGAGGALTSFGDDVLVLTHDGVVFAARSADSFYQTNLETPDNGLSAYRQIAVTDKYKDYTHIFDRVRYNDILYIRGPSANRLLISYTEFLEDDACYVTAIAQLEFDESIQSVDQLSAKPKDWEVIFRTQPCLPLKAEFRALEGHMAGGRLAFNSPSTLYLASGDYHWDGLFAPDAIAQDLTKQYGKVVEIDILSRASRIVSSGHRNTQGIAIDLTGNIWVTEHGMRGGDELNLILDGSDYGWPSETLGTRYNGLPAPGSGAFGRHDGFSAPTFAWVPSIATSNLTVVEGFADAWDGDLLVASLKDQSLFRIRVTMDRIVFAERIFIGRRIRYVHQHTDGRIAMWTDDRKLIFISPSELGAAATVVDEHISSSIYDEATQQKIRAAVDSCMECHSFEFGRNDGAPGLGIIFGAKIASTNFEGYSPELSNIGGRWTADELTSFIREPATFAPGTTMPDPGIDDPAVISGIVSVLEAISKAPGDL